ncbi:MULTISPECIES: hypothetical protein [Hyphobacterium]|uniref:PRC-barrel domain-containing protein n=1 Tax=Hyphobacterium vulgare TaxID=1736751 RepID=A0ABV6ZT92_9PROT
MQRIWQAGSAIAAATLFGASAPSFLPHHEAALEAARGLNGNVFFEARITEVDGRAVGTVERVHLDSDGQVEALDIRWRAGWTTDPFTLTQPVDRLSYDRGANTLIADARLQVMRDWAAEDARDIARTSGLPVNRVGEGVLAGAELESASGTPLGRLVDVETDETGTIRALVTVQRSGNWFTARTTRHTWPAEHARWVASERVIRLSVDI